MRRVSILAALLTASSLVAPASADAFSRDPTEPLPAESPERPRRNLRLGFGLGLGSIPPALCSGCERFEGRGLAAKVEIGWTLRPEVVLALVERLTVIEFADETAALAGGINVEVLYFRTPRMYLRGGLGIGLRNMEAAKYEASMKDRTEGGGAATGGIGYDIRRAGALSLNAEATATAIVTRQSFSGVLMTLLGVAWN